MLKLKLKKDIRERLNDEFALTDKEIDEAESTVGTCLSFFASEEPGTFGIAHLLTFSPSHGPRFGVCFKRSCFEEVKK